MKAEGVIHFEARHRREPLDLSRWAGEVRPLLLWRGRLHQAGLIGQDPARYEGAGYGNVSVRLPSVRGGRPFLITGSQTGGVRSLGPQDLCVVDAYDLEHNRVFSRGPALPSSESMTHGALYDLGPHVRFVFHVHSPEIWREAAALQVPATPPGVGYGTPQMAMEARLLARAHPDARVFVMTGHDDGVLAFGESAQAAGAALLRVLGRARA